MRILRFVPLLLLLSLLSLLGLGRADAQTLPAEHRAAIGPAGVQVRLASTFGKRAATSIQIGKAKAVRLHAGEAAGALVAGHDRVIVALASDAKADPFRIHVVEDGKAGEAIAIARPGARQDIPFAVVGAATATGFAIFFQEIQSDDPTAAHTYMVALDKTGKPSGAAKEIPIPWSLAAAVDNGAGFHLALIYPNEGMRLSMVSTDANGQPKEHPDWASPRGFLTDVHLVASDKTIRAIYRNGSRILEADVTKIREWGTEPPKPKSVGTIAGTQLIAIDKGKVVKVAR